jgi:hypothetical protein
MSTATASPYETSVAAGTFYATSMGDVQGTFYDDPAARWALSAGYLSPSDTNTAPLWGGVLVSAQVPTPATANPRTELGNALIHATTLTTTTASGGASGFAVYNQAYNGVITPGNSTAPVFYSLDTVGWMPFGCGAHLCVKADPSLVAYEGGAVGQQLSWDFNNQLLTEYDASTATIAASATVTWASTNGGQLTFPVANWTGAWQPAAGDTLNISGATNSGTGGAAAINTNFVVVSSTTTQAILAAPAASGVFGTIGGSPVINFGTGAFPNSVSLLRISTSNNMVVNWNGTTANWGTSGCVAIIRI